MSHTTQGQILKLPNGKFVRAYQSHTHTGFHDHIQATPDIDSATVFYPRDAIGRDSIRKKAEQRYPDHTVLDVQVTRTITIIQEGNQPCLPL